MTLSNRLSAFALAGLAVVLVAFSVTLYTMAHAHLSKQLDERVATTMDTLIALAEIEPDGLDWEPEFRRLPAQWEGDPPVWAIYDESGSRVDGSHDPYHRLSDFSPHGPNSTREVQSVEWNETHWQVARQTLHFPDNLEVRSRSDRKRYRTLVFVTAWPVGPVQTALRTLAWSLTGISMVIWLLAGLISRWLCRRALAPVACMTEAVKKITADDLAKRLPVPAARDELHDLATGFNELLARLQDSLERQRRFTGEASHQLRTPLTAMLGQLEVALRRERDPEEYRRVLNSAVSQAGRLRGIVESLLFLTRADAEARHPELELVDLAAWLKSHLAEVWFDHPRFRDLRVEVTLGEPVTINALPALLGQAVDNLLDNAFKYSDPGSHVGVRIARQVDEVMLAVEDRGPGIAAEDAARVFEPFFRSAGARRAGIAGVGLGLAIVARIANVLEGRITVEGRSGGGSRFLVRFPRPNTGWTHRSQPSIRTTTRTNQN